MNTKETLEALRQNEHIQEIHLEIVKLLTQSGILNILRETARPNILGDGSNLAAQASEAARSAGYFQCLDDIIDFVERYIQKTPSLNDVPLDYGGVNQAIQDGDLTKEEADAIRTGSRPKYKSTSITESIPYPSK